MLPLSRKTGPRARRKDDHVNDPATHQALTHLANINGFLREIAAELKAINQRLAAKEERRVARKPSAGAAHESKPKPPRM
jgi:hypothetical protein